MVLMSFGPVQDHIFSSYFTAEHHKKVQAFQQALDDGSAHVSWKDDVWAQAHGDDEASQPTTTAQGSSKGKAAAAITDRCGDSLIFVRYPKIIRTLDPLFNV